MMRKMSILAFACAIAANGQKVDRSRPPETPPTPAYHMPPVHEEKLANGLTVVLLEDPRFPLVTARLAFSAGYRVDPVDLPGLSEAVANLITEGTKNRASRQIADEAATIGGSVNASTSADALVLGGSALSEHVDKMLELVADVARNADFPADEVSLYKQNRQEQLLGQQSQPEFLGGEKLYSVIFGQNPYARRNPTSQSIGRIEIPALVQFRDTYLAPNNAFLILLGKLPPRAATMKTITRLFGDWQKRDIPALHPPAPPAPARSITLVDRPGSVQANIEIGRLGLTRNDPAYFPLLVGDTILGGGTSSRLFEIIREKKGYAYNVYSYHSPMRHAGIFVTGMQVRNEVTEPALRDTLAEITRMTKEPVTAAELSGVKNFLSGEFVLRLETQEGLAAQLASLKTNGMSYEYLEKFTTRIRSVEPDQIESAARQIMSTDQATIVVVGDASKIKGALDKFGKVEVVKAKP